MRKFDNFGLPGGDPDTLDSKQLNQGDMVTDDVITMFDELCGYDTMEAGVPKTILRDDLAINVSSDGEIDVSVHIVDERELERGGFSFYLCRPKRGSIFESSCSMALLQRAFAAIKAELAEREETAVDEETEATSDAVEDLYDAFGEEWSEDSEEDSDALPLPDAAELAQMKPGEILPKEILDVICKFLGTSLEEMATKTNPPPPHTTDIYKPIREFQIGPLRISLTANKRNLVVICCNDHDGPENNNWFRFRVADTMRTSASRVLDNKAVTALGPVIMTGDLNAEPSPLGEVVDNRGNKQHLEKFFQLVLEGVPAAALDSEPDEDGKFPARYFDVLNGVVQRHAELINASPEDLAVLDVRTQSTLCNFQVGKVLVGIHSTPERFCSFTLVDTDSDEISEAHVSLKEEDYGTMRPDAMMERMSGGRWCKVLKKLDEVAEHLNLESA
jgi:hypothetical protein